MLSNDNLETGRILGAEVIKQFKQLLDSLEVSIRLGLFDGAASGLIALYRREIDLRGLVDKEKSRNRLIVGARVSVEGQKCS